MSPAAPLPAPWKLKWVRHPMVEWLHLSCYTVLFGCHFENLPDLPRDAPVIFAGNHGSHFDFLFLLNGLHGRLKRNIRGVAWDEMAHIPVVRLLFYAYAGIPVSPAKSALALRKMVRTLRSGIDLWVQCEGSRHDVLGEFQTGAAAASLLSGAAIVPFSLRGVQPLFKELPWPDRLWGKVTIRFHGLIHPQPYLDKYPDLRIAAEHMTADVRAAVASGIDYPDGRAGSDAGTK